MSSKVATSEQIIERYQASVSRAIYKYTPVVFDRGEGTWVYDPEGRRYLDFAAGIATNNVGHAHPEVVAAIERQARQLIHAASHVGYYEPYVALAERLLKLAPEPLGSGRVLFVNSGSEAVEAAVKLARYATGRGLVLAFLGSFHGRPMGALALTASSSAYRRGYDALLAGAVHAPYPYPLRCPFGTTSAEACGQAVLRYIELLLKTVLPPDDLAAIVVEPILGEGGYVVPPDSFLPGLRQICDRTGALLVADEVQTGLGRTGRWFAFEHTGAVPDIVALAKPLGGGLPLGAVVARREVMDTWPPGAHGSTFGGNPVACAAGLATLDIMERENLVERAARLGRQMLSRLRELAASRPAIAEVRGRGLMVGLEMVERDGSPAAAKVRRALEVAAANGLILTKCGESVLRLCPPLTVSEAELDEGISALMKTIDEVF